MATGKPSDPLAPAGRLPPRVDRGRVLRSSPRLLPRVRPGLAAHADPGTARGPASGHRRGAVVDPGTPESSRVVPPLSEDVRGPAPDGDPAWRVGRADPDHTDRLPEGGLPRLLLDDSQVPPGC